jgi:steroid 5-alpha reductase family enzyme
LKQSEGPGWGTALVVVAATVASLYGTAHVAGGPELGGRPVIVWLAAWCLGVQWVAWVPAMLQRTEHYYDLTGSLTYLTGTAVAVAVTCASGDGCLDARGAVVAALVTIWATRLGLFLFRRVRRDGKDGRFDEIKRSAPRFLIAWTLQGLWVFWTALGAWILVLSPGEAAWGAWDYVGFSLWGVGFLLEVVADAQKSIFRARPENRGRWIDVGLWRWSRHPNYFGEILLWTGIAVVGAGQFHGGQWIGLISPVFVWCLLTQGSGVPILEARADERWGDDPDYQAYKDRTSILVPC